MLVLGGNVVRRSHGFVIWEPHTVAGVQVPVFVLYGLEHAGLVADLDSGRDCTNFELWILRVRLLTQNASQAAVRRGVGAHSGRSGRVVPVCLLSSRTVAFLGSGAG